MRLAYALVFVTAALCVASVASGPPWRYWFGWPAVALAVVTVVVLFAPLLRRACLRRSQHPCRTLDR